MDLGLVSAATRGLRFRVDVLLPVRLVFYYYAYLEWPGQRVGGACSRYISMLTMRWICAMALYKDVGATLDDLRKAVTTLEDAERIARRVLGGAHPDTVGIENDLRHARAALAARETPPPPRSA